MSQHEDEVTRRRFALKARTVFWLLLIGLATALLYVVFSTQLGQTALLICCGGVVLLVVIGIVSESGMRGAR
jgi:hypothetical protein